MRGFLGTAAALIFAFSLVTAIYTFMLANNDIAAPARVGIAVESARWAVEADVFNCSNPLYNGKTYNDATKAGVEVSGNRSNVTYSTGFMDMRVHLERDYAPSAWLKKTPFNTLKWHSCDAEGELRHCKLYHKGSVVKDHCSDGTYPTGGLVELDRGTYYVKVTDARGNTGYSNTVTVT